MKTYQFYPEFAWDDNSYSWTPEPFEASSVDEVLKQTKDLVYDDSEAMWSEDFYLTVYKNNYEYEDRIFDFHYGTEFRNSTLKNEYDKLFEQLKKELQEFFEHE